MNKLRHLDLFSGIGGFALGLERTGGFSTIAFCEIEPFPQKVLRKHWPDVPIYEDVRTIDATGLGRIDCITGGYPCQPFSTAGKRRGHEDDRHLWPAMLAVIQATRPTWVIGENVAGHISMGLDAVLSDLESEGYSCRPFVIPACAVDAPHRRDRVWIVAYCDNGHCRSQREVRTGRDTAIYGGQDVAHAACERCGEKRRARTRPKVRSACPSSKPIDVADAGGARLPKSTRSRLRKFREEEGAFEGGQSRGGAPKTTGNWPIEPNVGRVAHGVSARVDRLKGLGNAVVPQIPELIGHAILQAEGMAP